MTVRSIAERFDRDVIFRVPCALLAAAAILVAAGCKAMPMSQAPTGEPGEPRAVLPAAETTVVSGQAPDLALATSQALFPRSPAVVLVAEQDDANLASASKTAMEMGVPLLLTPAADNSQATAALHNEIGRLAAGSVVTVGDAAKQWAAGAPKDSLVAAKALTSNTGVKPGRLLDQLLVLALNDNESQAAVTTARAAGARVLLLSNPDPRTSDEVINVLAGLPTARILAVGNAFGPADQLRRRVDTAVTGVRLPGGAQVVFPGRRMVALYGHPGDTGLGSLGEQPVNAAVTRAKKVASAYAAFVNEPVIPTFEIIATVASASPGPDGDYSTESSIAHLRPWVEAARQAGMYVVLDLQPGLTDFLTQAKRYAELLEQPHVGLALDPEWRLKPGQRHMVQIGSVSAAEINATADWLAQLTRERKLPQKVLLLHQFRLDMITDRAALETGHDELKIVIHADGFGSQGQKMDTWRGLRLDEPGNIWWGWKNFYDEDRPMFTAEATVAIEPSPVFVSYQ